jgi:hypothetical protein
MACCERNGFVVEEEPREPAGAKELAVPAAKLERADDPEVGRVEADDLSTAVQTAAVAGPCAAQWDGHDVA